MDLKILIFLCLFANVYAFKLSSGEKLKDSVKGKKLWEGRSLTQNEIDNYMHKLGGPAYLGRDSSNRRLSFTNNTHLKIQLPNTFDSRYDKWPKCRSRISSIQDQSRCNSCWAVATASMLSDRICIATGGKKRPELSAINLAQCCVDCHSPRFKGDGCKGGWPIDALKFFAEEGIVTGGAYNSKNSCRPYPFFPQNYETSFTSGACQKTCDNKRTKYDKCKYYGKKEGIRTLSGVDEIKQEIYNYGPVVGTIEIHTEIFSYYPDSKNKNSKNIYHITNRDFPKGDLRVPTHAMRILGWGHEMEDNEYIPYWIIANSWGVEWGDKGILKVLMGTNEGELEDNVVTAYYDETRTP